jgi:hypothetical protein
MDNVQKVNNHIIIIIIINITAIIFGNQPSTDVRRPQSTLFQRRSAYIPVAMCPEFTAVLIRFVPH